MGDSFFGFNTNLPPLTDDELQSLREQGINNNKDSDNVHNYDSNNADVYDFETLRHELGVDEEEDVRDGLGDQMIEEGDDFNNVTFSDAPVGQDFDFSGNTQRFSVGGISEDEAFFVKRKPQEDPYAFHNPWATPTARPSSSSSIGRGFGESSPMATKSIWANFGAGVSPSSQNSMSPFSSSNRQPMRPQQQQQPFAGGMSPSASAGYQQQPQQQRRPVTLEDIEADIGRQQSANRYQQQNNNLNAPQPISLAELEAALVTGGMRTPQYQQTDRGLSPFGFAQPNSMQMLAMQQQQQGIREQKIARETQRKEPPTRKSQYDGLMTQHDKDFINRIQLSQLASGDPYADDFYYQVYSSLRQRAGIPLQSSVSNNSDHKNGGGGRGRREENTVQRMQQQLQRIVNDAKRRPKQTQVSLEGALGKITSLTVRNPRQVLQVPQASNSSNVSSEANTPKVEAKVEKASGTPTIKSTASTMDKRHVLKAIEDMYSVILELEQMRRQGPPQQRPDDDVSEKDPIEIFNQKHAATAAKLWTALHLTEEEEVPFLVSLLSVSKGKKLVPRIVRQLSHDQNLTLIKVFLMNFSKLQVCRHVIYPGTTVANVDEAKRQTFVKYEDVEIFMNAAAPSLLAFIAEAPLSTVNELLGLFLEKNDMMIVAQTKPGLAFLTMLLSRTEILKQGGGPIQGLANPSAEELNVWQEVYVNLFNSLKGHYLHIFPSLYYLVPLDPNTPMMQISLSVDDMYVWQFLAAMAVGASMDQQHILVTEVRDRVMENIILTKRNRLPLDQVSHRISNVNLFLHALGLDASQVSVPM